MNGIASRWARHPLAACRAAIFATLVPQPDDPAEARKMQKFIAELSDWDTSIDGESAAGKTSVQHSGRDAYALDTRHREPLVACRAATARSSG